MKKINWKGIFAAIHPGTTCRRYEVDINQWNYGRVYHFWTKRNALKRFNQAISQKEGLFINLNDWFIERPEDSLGICSTMGNPTTLARWEHPDAKEIVKNNYHITLI